MPASFGTAAFPLIKGIETKVDDYSVQPPSLLVAENVYAEKTGALRKRKGTVALSQLTVDNGAVTSTPAALARYRQALLLLDSPLAPNVLEYSETLDRWTEHGTYAPGVLQSEILSVPGNGVGVWAIDCATTNGYTLTAQTESTYQPGLAQTDGAVRISLQDAHGTFLCHRLLIFKDTTALASGSAPWMNLRIAVRGNQFYVFHGDVVNRRIMVWLCDTTSAATITTAIGVSGASAHAEVIVATDLHAAPDLCVFDVVLSNLNGIFLGYRTSTALQVKFGFVDTAGALASTTTKATVATATAISVARGSVSSHGVVYATALVGIYVFLMSWSGAAWTTTQASGNLAIVAGALLNIEARFDSSVALRVWSSWSGTPGPSANDTAVQEIWQFTYTTAAVFSGNTIVANRAQMATRPFFAGDGKLYFWATVGRRPGLAVKTLQPTHFLVDNSTGQPVAWVHQGVAVQTNNPPGALLPSVVDGVAGGYVCALMYVTRLYDGQPVPIPSATNEGAQNVGVRAVTWLLEHTQSHRVVEIGDCLYMAGGLLQQYDGVSFVEAGFLRYMESDSIKLTPSNSASGAMTSSATYYYRVIPEWTNARGMREQGTDSGPVSVVMGVADDTVTLSVPTIQMTRKIANAVGQSPRESIVFAIYRSEANPASSSSPLHRVGSVANVIGVNDVTFVDITADSAMNLAEDIYLTSGELDHLARRRATSCARATAASSWRAPRNRTRSSAACSGSLATRSRSTTRSPSSSRTAAAPSPRWRS
jgi:hypothetical protein